jgi:hypothetical protein
LIKVVRVLNPCIIILRYPLNVGASSPAEEDHVCHSRGYSA